VTARAPVNGNVDAWLEWQLGLHASEMDLGLERVGQVADALGVRSPGARCVVIAGTNGKGSCAALIDSLLRVEARVGSYTSPHLWRYNERFCIAGQPVTDAALCSAFRAVEAARSDVSLTFFEYGTLAALWLFADAAVDYAVLEVGLGGRLDAVNIVDADVALITNIGLDHVDWLGPDRERIGTEKAGVMRAGRPAICCDRDRSASIDAEAARRGARLACIGEDFDIDTSGAHWRFSCGAQSMHMPAAPGVLADNLAAALATVHALTGHWPVKESIARACRVQGGLVGRRERVDDILPIIYDVGHNAEAIAALVRELASQPVFGQTHVVLGMLAGKPVETVVAQLKNVADRFYFADLAGVSPRGLAAAALAARAAVDGVCFDHPRAALDAALKAGSAGDRVVVCGSFLTVAHARRQFPS
jgi:dihydrofolate synthase/folylpolyglutamate synthase